MVFQYSGIHFANIRCCYIRQTSDVLLGCPNLLHEQQPKTSAANAYLRYLSGHAKSLATLTSSNGVGSMIGKRRQEVHPMAKHPTRSWDPAKSSPWTAYWSRSFCVPLSAPQHLSLVPRSRRRTTSCQNAPGSDHLWDLTLTWPTHAQQPWNGCGTFEK